MTPFLNRREIAEYSRNFNDILTRDAQPRTRARTGTIGHYASEECRKRYAGLDYGPDGVIVPAELLFPQSERALSVSNFSGGGALVSEVGDSVFAKHLFSLGIFQLGVPLLPGLLLDNVSNVVIPSVTAIDAAEFLTEGAAATVKTINVAQRAAVPRRITITFTVSNQLLKQTSEQARATIWQILAGAVAAGLQNAALAGTGGAQPLGLLTAPGVGVVALGASGAAPTLSALNDTEGLAISANVPLTAGGYILSPNARKKCKATAKAAGTSTFLLETKDGVDYLNGYRAMASTAMPDNLTKGGGSALGSVVFGAWDNLVICQWGGIGIVSDSFSLALNSQTRITATLFADVVTPYPAAFARITDMVTT